MVLPHYSKFEQKTCQWVHAHVAQPYICNTVKFLAGGVGEQSPPPWVIRMLAHRIWRVSALKRNRGSFAARLPYHKWRLCPLWFVNQLFTVRDCSPPIKTKASLVVFPDFCPYLTFRLKLQRHGYDLMLSPRFSVTVDLHCEDLTSVTVSNKRF